MRCLVLNSYAGSLTLGASALGMDIIGSYEDSNFGLGIQKHNFPNLNFLEFRKQWPKQDLSETVVIAHPPCSAFSVQNCSPQARGVNSDAFSCTKSVLQYACENRALAVAIESVMGALGGAWNQHQRYADDYGYYLYRILENGCMWGPQWRERFWVLYIRKGAADPVIPLTITPRWSTVKEVVSGHEDGPAPGNLDRLLEKQKQRLLSEAGLNEKEMSFLFDPQDPPHKTKALGSVLWDFKFKRPDSKPEDKWQMFKKYIGGFASGTMCYLDPNGLSPVLMGGSHWYYNGRNLSETGFKRIMGFPADYVFPESPKNFRTQMRMYLSKGVMPPIAEWILEQATAHLGWKDQARRLHEPSGQSYTLTCEPNHIADFRITKQGWLDRFEKMPELRQFDEQPKPSKAYDFEDDYMNAEQKETLRLAKEALEWCGTIQMTSTVEEAETLRAQWTRPDGPAEIIARIERTLNPPPPPEPVPKPVKEKAARPERPVREPGTIIIPRTRHSDMRVFMVSLPDDKRRRKMVEIIALIGNPTLDEAVAACIADPAVQILPTTARWHIRQMIQAGQLKEGFPPINEEEWKDLGRPLEANENGVNVQSSFTE